MRYYHENIILIVFTYSNSFLQSDNYKLLLIANLISNHQISIFNSRVGIFHFFVFFEFLKHNILMLVIL